MDELAETNKAAATQFIEGFNNDDWDSVREVVASNFVLHHPLGGTNKLGPEGMVAVWSEFKAGLPDSWHPIPVMITEGDQLAVLLPTYGHFTGVTHQGVAPTGEWLEYGMVNIVRLEDGKLAEAWFGMDPVAEMQQMGAAPMPPPRRLSQAESANIELFHRMFSHPDVSFDNIEAFGDVVVVMGPPQYADDASTRKIDIYRESDGSLELVRSHGFTTKPPFGGDRTADTELSRSLLKRFFEDVLVGHDLKSLAEIASPDILIHPTAMPCEAGYYGISGATRWLEQAWIAFPDLTITEYSSVANGDIIAVRWTARGTSQGIFLMLPPTGDVVEYSGVSMYRIEGGKVAEIWETRDTFTILRQLNPEIGKRHHDH